MTQYAPRQIFKIDNENIVFTVIDNDRHGDGFYYYESDWYGNPKGQQIRPWHSNCLLSKTITDVALLDKKLWKVVLKENKSKEFEIVTCGKYHWVITGIPEVDNEMPNVDMRYQLFIDNAPENVKRLYEKNEDDNLHMENAQMVAKFAQSYLKHISKFKSFLKE